MASHHRIFNITRKLWLKPRRAERGICECSWKWVEFGVSVRDLTLAESIQKRNEQAAVREPLAYAEIPGLKFEGPIPTDYGLIRAAHELCAQ